jgi:hypothetical protein
MRPLPWFAITLAMPIIAGAAEEWQPVSPQDLSLTARSIPFSQDHVAARSRNGASRIFKTFLRTGKSQCARYCCS